MKRNIAILILAALPVALPVWAQTQNSQGTYNIPAGNTYNINSAPHSHDASTLDTDSVSADELNATGVEAELEAVLDLQDLQGALTDGQVPDTITITLLNQLNQALNCASPTELTLDTNGDINIPNNGCFDVDTDGDIGSDTWDGGGTCPAGTVFAIRAESDVRDVILSSSGMQVVGAVDQTLDQDGDVAFGFCPTTDAKVIWAFSDEAGAIKATSIEVGANPQPLRTSLVFPFSNGGSVLAENQYVEFQIHWACNIIHSTLVGTPSGSVSIDLWVDVAGTDGATYPPTNLDSITAAAQPALTTDTYAADSTLTGWTTLLPGPTDKDDPATYSWIRANIEGTPATTTFAQLTLTCELQ